jgi:cysteine dioxygenase
MSPAFYKFSTTILPNQDTVQIEPPETVDNGAQKTLQRNLAENINSEYATDAHYDEQIMTSDSDASSVDGTIVCETNFDRLVEDIRTILGPSSGIDSADVDVEDLMAAMREYDSRNEHEWEKYALNDPTRHYTRNGVDNINHKANLLILVWNQGKGSLIHDHANAHCIVKILKGSLKEELYHPPTDSQCPSELALKKVSHYTTNDVSYMSDELGLHRMMNPSDTEVAVSLHLYTPPYASKYGCRVFNEDGTNHKVNLSNLYSDKGKRNLGPKFGHSCE